ncbi:unnamed protein product [Gadus morhua 'NCC']
MKPAVVRVGGALLQRGPPWWLGPPLLDDPTPPEDEVSSAGLKILRLLPPLVCVGWKDQGTCTTEDRKFPAFPP